MAAVNLSNLLVAGRCISAESDAAGAIRVMPPCMGIGQAAGTAAAMAAGAGTDLRELNTASLRDLLRTQGVMLDEEFIAANHANPAPVRNVGCI